MSDFSDGAIIWFGRRGYVILLYKRCNKKEKMKVIIQAIKDRIAECKKSGSMFTMPQRDGYSISEQELPCSGADIDHREYTVSCPSGEFVRVDYRSKDKSKTFSIVPDVSCVRVNCSDRSYNFSDSWNEGKCL